MTTRACCCASPCSQAFSCPEDGGNISWTFNTSWQLSRACVSQLYSCCDCASDGNCPDPIDCSLGSSDLSASYWSGSFDMIGSVVEYANFPQSLQNSSTSPRCDNLGEYTPVVPPGICTESTTITPSCDLKCTFTGRKGESCCETDYFANYTGEIRVEARIKPGTTVDSYTGAIVRSVVANAWDCENCRQSDIYFCKKGVCFLDVAHRLMLYEKLEFRVVGEFQAYELDDPGQTQVVFTDSYETEWIPVLENLSMRRLYEGPSGCASPATPNAIHPMSYQPLPQSGTPGCVFPIGETDESFVEDVKRVIKLGMADWWNTVLGAVPKPAGFLFSRAYAPTNSNAQDTNWRAAPYFWGTPLVDDEGYENIDGDGDFLPPDICATSNYFETLTPPVTNYQRSMTLVTQHVLDDCDCFNCDRTGTGQVDDAFFQRMSHNVVFGQLQAIDCIP